MRKMADRLNLLRGAAADQTTRKLRRAGFMSRDATVVYIFVKLALPLALGFVMILLTSVSASSRCPDNLILPICIGAVLAGFVLPEALRQERRRQAARDPELRAARGARPADDLRRGRPQHRCRLPPGRREMQTSMPELSAEFEMTAIELTYLPDRQQALENMTERSNSPAIAALVNALRQTEKYGTPLANSLRVLSQEFRLTRASKAEEKGARMPALMTVPLMVFILPTLITVLLAPAIMSAFAFV